MDQLRLSPSKAAPSQQQQQQQQQQQRQDDTGRLELLCGPLKQYSMPEPGSGMAPDIRRAERKFDHIEQARECWTAVALRDSGLAATVAQLCEHADSAVRHRAETLQREWVAAGLVPTRRPSTKPPLPNVPPPPKAPPPLPPSAPPGVVRAPLVLSKCTAAVELVRSGRARWVSFCLDR